MILKRNFSPSRYMSILPHQSILIISSSYYQRFIFRSLVSLYAIFSKVAKLICMRISFCIIVTLTFTVCFISIVKQKVTSVYIPFPSHPQKGVAYHQETRLLVYPLSHKKTGQVLVDLAHGGSRALYKLRTAGKLYDVI